MNKGWYVTDGFPYVLDLTDCKDWHDLHGRIRKLFAFPDYYGENWAAMWDCLTDLFGEEDEGEIIIAGFSAMPQDLQKYAQTMLAVFDDLHEEFPKIVCRYE